MTVDAGKRVALILNDGLRAALSAGGFDIFWISETPSNLALEPELEQLAARPEVTWFAQRPQAEETTLEEILTLIEDHHGPYTSDRPWNELLLFGASDNEALGRVLVDDGEFDVDSSRGLVKRVTRE